MSKELKCWSCKAVFTLTEHGNCDGCCWKCGVEIDLDEMDIQPADQHPQGNRERFQKWVLSIEHPVKGWLDGHWLRRGDDREGYADEYVQGLWVAFKTFGAQTADQQGEPVAWAYMKKGPESYSAPRPFLVWASEDIDVMRQGLKTGDHVHYIPRPDLYDWRPLFYGHAQPATAKVVLPERLPEQSDDELTFTGCHNEGWNDCLDEAAKLNTPQ
ncbi:hypothetical protein PS689_05457 [Pseudomonas fluorescens]|nr:hypothetical protein PS689_05457 [Pseudomonas fluorescens]